MTIDFLKIAEMIKDPDLRMKIVQLYGENIELAEENHKLRGKAEEIKKNEEIQSKLSHKDNHYYMQEIGPFCTKCWDVDNKLVRLHQASPHNGLTNFSCPNCKTYTTTGTYVQPGVGGTSWNIS